MSTAQFREGSHGQRPEAPPAQRQGRRTRRTVAVTHREARILATDFPAVESTTIRQCLEFEPLKEAIALLEWAANTDDPARSLKDRAAGQKTGYYRPRDQRPSANEEYERYLAFLADHQRETLYHHLPRPEGSDRKAGTKPDEKSEQGEDGGRVRVEVQKLSRSEVEELTYEFYAPAYRVEMERIIPANIPHTPAAPTTAATTAGTGGTNTTDGQGTTGGTKQP